MSDETREERAASSDELITKDLAEAGDRGPRKLQSEPILVPAIPVRNERDDEYRGEAARPAAAAAAPARAKEEELGPLFPAEEANNLRARWDTVQTKFVDEPRQAVEDADLLIAATMKRLAEIFADERENLEHQWDRGENVSTEDLRLGLRRYRSFFSRLLKV
jgi:hypothetical protein